MFIRLILLLASVSREMSDKNLSELTEIEVPAWLEVNMAILLCLVLPGRLHLTFRCIDFKFACLDRNLAANMASLAVRNGACFRMNAALSTFAQSISLGGGILAYN